MRVAVRWLAASMVLLSACGEKPQATAQPPATVAEPAAPGATRPEGANRLVHEKSPYLLQHAYNPVDWYPWGDEAFERAEAEGKPVFLSIGYSTCHWCHVMERESFEDPQIAAFMNEHFVNIKVDREERPDVDRVYMLATQAMTGSGGWPMSVFLTHDRKPFFAGTYFPPRSEGGRPGFREVMQTIQSAWSQDRGKVLASAEDITARLKQYADPEGKGELAAALLDQARSELLKLYDAKHGGFGSGEKFPQPSQLLFLMREHARTGDQQALKAVEHTLAAMAAGGIRDHLGGGFHRYSVDPAWRVPHFEKMLYDQAQLAIAYTEAWQLTGNPAFKAVAQETLDYVVREMQDPLGGFHSATDADSPKPGNPDEEGEGAFFTWTAADIDRVLGEDAAMFRHAYGIEDQGNATVDPQGEFKGLNILYRANSNAQVAKKFGISETVVASRLAKSRGVLFEARSKRPRPHLDDKVLVSWNGLMISALAKAALAFDEPHYTKAAVAAAGFVHRQLWRGKDGQLLRRWRDGEAAIDAQLEDYAFFIQGLLDLYEAEFDHRRLVWAGELIAAATRKLWDEETHAFREAATGGSELPYRVRGRYDDAVPSASSVMAVNLLRYADISGDKALLARAKAILEGYGAAPAETPSAVPSWMMALEQYLGSKQQVIIAGGPKVPGTNELLDVVRGRYMANRLLLLADGGEGQAWLAKRQPVFEAIERQGDAATAYFCEDFVCQKPTTDPRELARQLARGGPGKPALESATPD